MNNEMHHNWPGSQQCSQKSHQNLTKRKIWNMFFYVLLCSSDSVPTPSHSHQLLLPHRNARPSIPSIRSSTRLFQDWPWKGALISLLSPVEHTLTSTDHQKISDFYWEVWFMWIDPWVGASFTAQVPSCFQVFPTSLRSPIHGQSFHAAIGIVMVESCLSEQMSSW